MGEKGNATTLTLKPKSGTWVDGAIGKGDKGRGFTFDTSKSVHSREAWAAVIRKQIQIADELHGRLEPGGGGYPQAKAKLKLPMPTGKGEMHVAGAASQGVTNWGNISVGSKGEMTCTPSFTGADGQSNDA